MLKVTKNKDKNIRLIIGLHDLIDFYTITSQFTRFECVLHDYKMHSYIIVNFLNVIKMVLQY